VIAALAERDNFKNQLEAERGQHRLETDALRNRYAGLSCASEPPKVQDLGQVVAAPEAPRQHRRR
jgi:hypothetical protein